MNLPFRLFAKPEPLPHVVVRYHAATKRENIEAATRRRDTKLALAVYVAQTSPEQRALETQLHAAVAASLAIQRKRG